MIQQGDILLVPFPFSDQSGKKVRPVVVISNNEFNQDSEDVLVAGVTSNISRDKYTIILKENDLEEGKLISDCCVKVENILKIEKELVIKKIGKINKETLKKLKSVIISLIDI